MLTNRKRVRRVISTPRRRYGRTTDPPGVGCIFTIGNMTTLCPSRELLDTAMAAGNAIAAVNFYNAETLLAHTRAANALNASIILQTTEATINYLGLRMIVAMARAAADEMEQPAALHLDHGSNYDLAARCIEHGYTSVMIDGSKLSFAGNCAIDRKSTRLNSS